MALPTTIVSAAGQPGHHPPVISSGGDVYAVVSDGQTIDVYKATDPTDSWTVQDASNNPVLASGLNVTSLKQESDLIHIGFHGIEGIADRYWYVQFDMADDTWLSSVSEQIQNFAIDAAEHWISMEVRSDGDVIAVYNGSIDKNKGDDKERVDVSIRTSGTWSGPTSLDAGGDVHYGNPNVVKGPLTDDMHILWGRQTATADPPAGWGTEQARTLDPSDVLSTTDDDSISTGFALLAMQNAVSYDSAGPTQRVTWHGVGEFSGRPRKYWNATEDGSDDIVLPGGVTDTTGADAFINGEVAVTSIAELDGDIHQLYSGGGTDGVDQDLYYTKSTDDGATWDAPTEEIDAVTINFLSANIYVRGLDTVLAYVYDDGGVQKYNEKVLIAGATAFPYHVFKEKRRDMRNMLTL